MEEDDNAFVGNTHMSRRVPSSGDVKEMEKKVVEDDVDLEEKYDKGGGFVKGATTVRRWGMGDSVAEWECWWEGKDGHGGGHRCQ